MHFLTETKRISGLVFDKRMHVGAKKATPSLGEERDLQLSAKCLREGVELVNEFFYFLMFDLNYSKVVDVIPDKDNASSKESDPQRILKIIYYKRKKHNISWLHITDDETRDLFDQVSQSLKVLNSLARFDDSTPLQDCFLPNKKVMSIMNRMKA